MIDQLKATGKFELMDIRVDEAEHSMEMHLPYIAKVFEGYSFFQIKFYFFNNFKLLLTFVDLYAGTQLKLCPFW